MNTAMWVIAFVSTFGAGMVIGMALHAALGEK